MAGKLHEILAVEPALEKTARKLSEESIKTFSKVNLFNGSVKRLKMFTDGEDHLETEEIQTLTTTVDENIDYLLNPIAKYWDTVLAKERGNQAARADIVLEDGTILAQDLPVTFLLGLEAKLGKLRTVYEAIPTLAPGIKWVKDENERAGVLMNANDSVTFKTRKNLKFLVAYEATKEHPAQVRDIDDTVSVGSYTTTVQCGMISPLEKATRISRVDEALLAVKKARMRANAYKVETNEKVGRTILNFVNEGKLPQDG